jgi:hypothetical protein
VEGPVHDGKDLMFVRGSGIPAMFVDVDSGSMYYLHQDKNHTEHGQLRLYGSNGQSLFQGELYSIKGRGQSSWLEEKKSYNIRLRTSADLLGMGNAENWVLQANSKDASGIRNKMIFDFANAAGLEFAPDSQWVDLYLNGEYAGLYLLCERIEVHPERVDVPQKGSFLVSKDGVWRFEEEKVPFVVTQANTALEIKYSDYDSQTLRQMWQSVENAILADNGIDPGSGKHWTELIDVDSWVKKYLIEEVFGNLDGQMLSQYYYLDGSRGDGRISAGPVWDYDLAVSGAYNAYHLSKPEVRDSLWQPALFAKEEFFEHLRQTYGAVFRPLLQQLIDTGIDGYAGYIRDSQAANSMRWFFWDMEQGAEDFLLMKQYLQERATLFDRIWTEAEPYIRVTLVDYQGFVSVRVQEPGSLLPELSSVAGYDWFCDTGEMTVDRNTPVYEDITVRQRKTDPDAAEAAEYIQEDQPEEELPLQRYAPVLVLLFAMVIVAAVDFRRRLFCTRSASGKKIGMH